MAISGKYLAAAGAVLLLAAAAYAWHAGLFEKKEGLSAPAKAAGCPSGDCGGVQGGNWLSKIDAPPNSSVHDQPPMVANFNRYVAQPMIV